MMQDIGFAARLLTKERGFTAGAIAVLGLGLGVNTTVFTIINGMSLRGLPVHRPDEIMQITSVELQGRRQEMYTSYADFLDWRTGTHTFSGLAAYAPASMNVGDERRPADRVAGWFISANAFSLLGVPPLVGRGFAADDDRPGAAPVAMLSHVLWRDRYGADPAIVGGTIRINGTPATVIGVMPEGFRFPVLAEVWQPAAQHPTFNAVKRDHRTFNVFGRLRDDVTVEQARVEFAAIAGAIATDHPDTNAAIGTVIEPFTESYVGPVTEGPPMMMMAAGVLVLLIACANAANLLLVRATHRRREMALRAALGASRARIVRQLLVESVMLSTLGGVAGLILAVGAVRVFAREAVDLNLPYWIHFSFDARVFAYVALLSLATAVTCGLVPAWQLSSARAHEILKSGGHGTAGTPRNSRWAGGLLVSELALTLTLLAGAGLLVRSAVALSDADAVLDLHSLVTGQLAIPPARFATPDERRAFVARLQERLEAAPGLASATIASARPFVDAFTRQLVLAGESAATSVRRSVQMVAVGDRYFETLNVPIRRGRALGAQDGRPGSDVVVINERFAALHFGGADPVGQRIQLIEPGQEAKPAPWLTIVGVSPSVRQRPMGDAAAVAYLPLRAQPTPLASVIARGATDRVAVAATLRDAVRSVDPDAAVYNVESLQRLSEKSRWTPRLLSTLLAVFGAIATLLSAAGLYAVTAYGVARRTSEIGIRVALGAQRSQVAWLFLRRTLMYVGLGLLIGLGGALAMGQVLRSVLVQTSPTDPAIFAGMVLLMIVTAAAACLIPTRRATRLNPVEALRRE